MIAQPGTFADIVRIDPQVFMNHIIRPLWPYITLPHGYLAMPEYQQTGNINKRRSAQISREDRLLRWILVIRGIPISVLAYLFGQTKVTVYNDFVHISTVVFERLSAIHLMPMTVGSPEYIIKRGQGPFRLFPTCVYAVDVVKV